MLDRSGFECLTDQVSNCLIFELLNGLNSMRVFVFVNVKINHVKTVEYTILYLIENQQKKYICYQNDAKYAFFLLDRLSL